MELGKTGLLFDRLPRNFLFNLSYTYPLCIAAVSGPNNAASPDTLDAYGAWLNRRIGLEVTRLRQSTGLSTYRLAHERPKNQ